MKPKPLDLENENPYPEDIFPEITKEEWDKIDKLLLKEMGFSVDRVAGNVGRKLWNGIREKFRERIKSAVQGLLNEIEEDIKYWEKEMDKYEDKLLNAKSKEERRIYDRAWKIAGEVHRILDVRVKELIKYYFKDVLKGDSDEEEQSHR